MPCRHPRARLSIVLTKTTEAEMLPARDCAFIKAPAHLLRISAACPHCHFGSIFNAYQAETMKGAAAWPAWLLEHLAILCQHDLELRAACLACHVPGIEKES